MTWSLNTVNSLQFCSRLLCRPRIWIAVIFSYLCSQWWTCCLIYKELFQQVLNMSHLSSSKKMSLMSLGSAINFQCSAGFKFGIVQMAMEDAHWLMPVTSCTCFTPPPAFNLYILNSLLPPALDVEPPDPVYFGKWQQTWQVCNILQHWLCLLNRSDRVLVAWNNILVFQKSTQIPLSAPSRSNQIKNDDGYFDRLWIL